MTARRIVALATALALAACGGRAVTPSAAGSNPAPQPGGSSLVRESFTFLPPSSTSSAARHPHYITANVASVEITLNSVNGAAPSTGASLSVTTNISMSSCPCTVHGPDVPAGSDTFTLAAYDQPNAGGNLIATASPTYTIVAGQANNETVTLNGVPSSLALALPSATAGTAFASPQSMSVTAKDGDGNTILGTYAIPITIGDSDTSGATLIATSGSDTPPANTLLSSSDAATIAYSGLAIAPATIALRANAAAGSAAFAPALQPIVVTVAATPGALNPNSTGVDLTAGASTGSFTASEAGWTNAPYNKSLTLSVASGCASIASVAPASGTSFTATVRASPVAGSCIATLTDGNGQSQAVTLAYTSFTYTDGPQSFTVPPGVTLVDATVAGAQGSPTSGAAQGGLGGEVLVTIPTIGGEVLWVYVGGSVSASGGAPGGGYNGGGAGFVPGGGASDVRTAYNDLASRLVVAPGGGGGSFSGAVGGGGGSSGVAGGGSSGGAGATPSGPGLGGTNGYAGQLGNGGTGSVTTNHTGGGGGGGYYGGGGGGDDSGGGGGSLYIDPSCYTISFFPYPVNAGNGYVQITF
ncbi:MAG TPA: glycine-rich protein [Candidatus Acidoferrum sp.]|nr:glycine-rich protein [Candidatus Acidoferrum sp.]